MVVDHTSAIQVIEEQITALSQMTKPTPNTITEFSAQENIKEIEKLKLTLQALKSQPAPPYGSKRAAAMAIYKPPFKHIHGYIYDANHHVVADDGGFGLERTVEGAVAARVRGWGRIGYMPNAHALQDEVGAMMADALNLYYETKAKNDSKT